MNAHIGRLAIIGAMPEELAAVMQDLVTDDVIEIAGRQFHCGRLHGHDVVLVVSRMGKVAAATTATILIERFDAQAIVFTGVAGGVAAELRVGDIVIAEQLLHHDLDARPIFPRWEVPLLGMTHFATGDAWTARAAAAADRVVAAAGAILVASLGITNPRVHRGLIVSGDQFVAATEAVLALRTALPAALAVEMEGAAVAQVCHEFSVPCAIIRVISDTADHAAGVDFPRFVAQALGPYSRALVRELLTVGT